MKCDVGLRIPLVLLAVVGACGEPTSQRLLPHVSVVDGVEIANLGQLPQPLDQDHWWTFRVVSEIHTVLDDDADPLLFDPTQVLPLRSGALLVHDPSAEKPLVILDRASGSVLQRFGRSGQGPGELGGGILLTEAEDGTLVVVDASNRQVHRYSRTGAWLTSITMGLDASTGRVGQRPHGGGYLVEVLQGSETAWWRELHVVDAGTGDSEFFLRLPDPSLYAEPGRIQRGRVLWTVLSEGVVGMWSDRPSLKVYGQDGILVREIRLPLTRREITERDIAEQVKRYGGMARSLRTGPAALTNMLYAASDTVFGMLLSGLWRGAEDPALPAGQIYWRLFTIRGEYIGVAQQPQDFRFLGTGPGTLWARVLDGNGYPVIREFELVRKGGK